MGVSVISVTEEEGTVDGGAETRGDGACNEVSWAWLSTGGSSFTGSGGEGGGVRSSRACCTT